MCFLAVIAGEESGLEGAEGAVCDGGADAVGEVDDEVLVVDASEDLGGDFVSLEEVMKVSFSIILAKLAVAIWHQRGKIVAVFSVFDIDTAVISIKGAVARHASGTDAVKSVATELGADEEIAWLLAHAEEVTRFVFRENGVDGGEHLGHAVSGEDAANTEAVDGLSCAKLGGLGAEVEKGAALDHGVEVLRRLKATRTHDVFISQSLVFSDATFEPSVGAAHGALHVGAIVRLSEVVESHVDVGADGPLGLHARLRGDFKLVAVDVGFELGAVFVNLDIGERKNLKTARIGKSGAVPARELSETTRLLN